jgi:hypothetical protein
MACHDSCTHGYALRASADRVGRVFDVCADYSVGCRCIRRRRCGKEEGCADAEKGVWA